ncbi:MBL fold metallo-hydrolase [Paenibacillus rhizoplanae]
MIQARIHRLPSLPGRGVLEALSLTWRQVRDIVVTHHHPDHYGLAGWMQSRSGARVWMTERAHTEAGLAWGDEAILNEALPVFFSGGMACRRSGSQASASIWRASCPR